MVIVSLSSVQSGACQKLAQATGLSVVGKKPENYYLIFENQRLCVRDSRQGAHFKIQVDFEVEFKKLKEQKLNPKKDLLSRAVGFKSQENYTVFDGTLGFAKDSLHLLTMGCSVIGCEQNPVVFALLQNALNYYSVSPQFSIIYGDSSEKIIDYKEVVDCLYLDPMFENAKKKSAPKKKMALLRELSSGNGGVEPIISRAIESGVKRVVVKRPINGDHLYGSPQRTFKGKLIRYDVYVR